MSFIDIYQQHQHYGTRNTANLAETDKNEY